MDGGEGFKLLYYTDLRCGTGGAQPTLLVRAHIRAQNPSQRPIPRSPATADSSCTASPNACEATSATLTSATIATVRASFSACPSLLLGGRPPMSGSALTLALLLGRRGMVSNEFSSWSSVLWTRASACATASGSPTSPPAVGEGGLLLGLLLLLPLLLPG